MKIGKLCRRRIVTVDATASLAHAATLMREHHVGALVVTSQSDEGVRVAGVVTDRDLVIDVLARALSPTGVAIGDLASQRIASVAESDDVETALEAMRANGVRRLLVTNAEQQLVGFVSLDDLTDACAAQIDSLAEVIRSGMEREVAETAATPPAPPLQLRVPAMGTAGWGQALV